MDSDDSSTLLNALIQVFNEHRARIEAYKAEVIANQARAEALREAAEALRIAMKRQPSPPALRVSSTPENIADEAIEIHSTPVDVKTELNDLFPSQSQRRLRKEVHPRVLRAKVASKAAEAPPMPLPAVPERAPTPEPTPREYWSLSFR